MEALKLGQLITTEANRDAVHVAVAPLVAACRLTPGVHVGLTTDGRATLDAPLIGVVDPFLSVVVERGQRFWLFLYPGSTQALRHEWTHPLLPVLAAPVSAAPTPAAAPADDDDDDDDDDGCGGMGCR